MYHFSYNCTQVHIFNIFECISLPNFNVVYSVRIPSIFGVPNTGKLMTSSFKVAASMGLVMAIVYMHYKTYALLSICITFCIHHSQNKSSRQMSVGIQVYVTSVFLMKIHGK